MPEEWVRLIVSTHNLTQTVVKGGLNKNSIFKFFYVYSFSTHTHIYFSLQRAEVKATDTESTVIIRYDEQKGPEIDR